MGINPTNQNKGNEPTAWQKLDTDGNGTLSKAEIEAAKAKDIKIPLVEGMTEEDYNIAFLEYIEKKVEESDNKASSLLQKIINKINSFTTEKK